MLLIETDPGPETCYFWAHQFALVGGSGGYLGLQTRGGTVGPPGKVAIFSIWDASAARGVAANRFGGEGEGWSCHIRYPWEAGRQYRLRLGTPEPSWWVATVTDEITGVEEPIGWIQVPHTWQRLGAWSVMWTEWYGGPLARCEDLPYSSVVFHTPAADAGAARPLRADDHLATGASCRNSAIERVVAGSRQRMGLKAG